MPRILRILRLLAVAIVVVLVAAPSLAVATGGPDGPPVAPRPAGETLVVLLRHAEKTGKHPLSELSAPGRRRAEALIPLLVPYRPAALYASDRKRTLQTLAPLARRLGLAVEIRPLGAEEALAGEILVEHRGTTVVVCGHSDSLAQIASDLGYPGTFPPVEGFDRLWIVRIPADEAPPTLEERPQPLVPRRPPDPHATCGRD